MVLKKGKKSTFFSRQYVVLAALSVALLLPVTAMAGIRIFDENQGQDIDAKQQGGKLEALPTLKIEKAPRRDLPVAEPQAQVDQTPLEERAKEEASEVFSKYKSPSDIVLGPFEEESYHLGHAQIFVDIEQYDQELAKALHKVMDIDNLRVDVYMKDFDSFDKLVTFTTGPLLFSPADVDFKRDSRNKKFHELHLTEHNSIYYTSPFGDSRVFPLNNPQYILNKVDYVRRELGNR